MPKIATTGTNQLKPYLAHGIDLQHREGDRQAIGDCPFCGREGKFSVVITTGLWRCIVCPAGNEKGGGNSTVFLRELWKQSGERTSDYKPLVSSRKLLSADTLKAWGVVKSLIDGTWLVPGYNAAGSLTQLYRYVLDRASGKHRLYATPETPHGMFGVNLWDKKRDLAYITEGPWDAMAFWEVLNRTKSTGGKLELTGQAATSLGADANVIAVPGANVFQDGWLPLFKGKTVSVLFDSDHPKEHQGKTLEPVGYVGMKRVANRLGAAEEPPEAIEWLNWGDGGYDSTLPSGTDIRDFLSKGKDVKERITQLAAILNLIEPIPEEWLGGRKAAKGEVGDLDCLPCDNWKLLTNQWRKPMKWTEGLDLGLSVMLAVVVSTMAVGDQLWAQIVGPPACGKSTLCEALSINKKYIAAKSTIRGFHSGYQTDSEGVEDNSLIAKVRNKTLVTKDGDTLLQSPNVQQILSEARDVYDRTSRADYRNKASRSHEGVNLTWILCGTSSLRSLDTSELGERFLRCVIMRSITDELEDEILDKKALQAFNCLQYEANGSLETQHDPDLVNAMRLTGGYVSYLRENALELFKGVSISPKALGRCKSLGKFVAFMRARPSKSQEEKAEREFGTRLVSQFVRLAGCLAVVMNKSSVDDEVLKRVTRVALDTAEGRTLEIARWLFKAGSEGLDPKPLAMYTNEPEEGEKKLLRFLRRIGAVETYNRKVNGVSQHPRWRLTEKLREIYDEVMPDELRA